MGDGSEKVQHQIGNKTYEINDIELNRNMFENKLTTVDYSTI